MYTGTLINDLTALVCWAEEQARQRRMAEELHEIFMMQIPVAEGEQAYQGAA